MTGARAANAVEIEWQFDALDLRPVERWLAALPLQATKTLPALTAQAQPPRRMTDRYLDTADWRIGRAGLVLRTRRRGRRDEATLKDTRPAGAGGLRERLEVTQTLPPGGLEELGPEGAVGWRLDAVVGRRPLHQILEVRTRRRPFSLRVAGAEVAEVALDDTVVDVGPDQPPVRLRRVEVEVVPEWIEALTPLVEDLRTSSGLQPATLSKFEAGLLALGAEIPGRPDLGPSEVTPTSTFGELAFAVLRRHLGVLLDREPGTRLGEDIEELHDMRVATRRLRAAIDLFAAALPVRAQTLSEELGWLARGLGHVRDLDVQIEKMDDTVEEGSPLDDLRRLLQAERRGARQEMLAALDSARWERLAAGLVSVAQQGPNRRSPVGRLPAALAVPDLVLERHRAVAKGARRAKRSGVAADFHRLRIRCKRLRYSLEFTAGIYEGRTERFTRRMARLQEALGLMQDAEVATERLFDLATRHDGDLPPATIFAMGGVAERYRIEAAELLDGMAGRLNVLTGKEWDDLVAHMAQRRVRMEASLPVPRPARPPRPAEAAEEIDRTSHVEEPPVEEEPSSSVVELSIAREPTTALATWPDPVWTATIYEAAPPGG